MDGWFALLASASSWLIAQTWKTLAGIWGGRKRSQKMTFGDVVDYVTRSGGMPSGHSASMVAMTTYIGMACGFGSEIFALAFAVTMIVMYDAIHVRYAVGRQGKALNGLLKKAGEDELPVVEGHTVPQVIVGATIGIVIGVLVGILTKS